MDTRRLLAVCAFALGASSFAHAQSGYVTGPGGAAVKNPFGLCWRSADWTPALATAECDPDLVAKPRPTPVAAPPPAPGPIVEAPKPAPVAPPPPPKPAPLKPAALTLGASELFGFNQATLTPQGRKKLDSEVIERSRREYSDVRVINVSGHSDRLGAADYNQRLSQRRADAVRAYLVSRGFEASKIETYGFGKTNPVKSCPNMKVRKQLIECLAPNRRVEIEIQGTKR